MKIPKHHEEALVLYFQMDEGLKEDGIYGPQTAKALDKWIADAEETEPAKQHPLRAVFDSAYEDLGKGEKPLGSNSGPYLEHLRTITDLPRKGGGEWCAVFISAHCQLNGIDIGSRGAPGIVREMAKLANGKEVDIDDIGAGFVGLALRKRGRISHHVQIFRCFMSDNGLRIHHVGGNEGNRVRSKEWKPKDFFKGVIKVATIQGDE